MFCQAQLPAETHPLHICIFPHSIICFISSQKTLCNKSRETDKRSKQLLNYCALESDFNVANLSNGLPILNIKECKVNENLMLWKK